MRPTHSSTVAVSLSTRSAVIFGGVKINPQIDKLRYTIPWAGMVWEVDECFGVNQGLIVAEIELEREDQDFARPEWIGAEVTGDPRYANSALCAEPFTTWK